MSEQTPQAHAPSPELPRSHEERKGLRRADGPEQGDLGACNIFSIRENLRRLGATSGIGVLDGIRAIAILWVIAYHTTFFYIVPYQFVAAWPQRLAMVGDLGVDVFFVLSGFLISSILLSELEKSGTIAIRRFYFRRALRILPAYYVALAGWAAIGMPAALGYAMPRSYIWANILYINNYLPYLHQFMNLSWSLAIEEHFYLLFPLFLLLLSRVQALSRVTVFSLLLTSIGVAVADAALRGYMLPIGDGTIIAFEDLTRYFEFAWRSHVRFGSIVWGVFLAMVRREYSALRTLSPMARHAAGLLGFLLLGFVVIFHPTNPAIISWPQVARCLYAATHRNIVSAGVFFLMLLALSPSPRKPPVFVNILAHPFWRPLAHLSYSAYLLNEFSMSWFFVKTDLYRHFSNSAFWVVLSFLLATSVTLVGALVLHLLVERPLMNLRQVLDKRRARMEAGYAGH